MYTRIYYIHTSKHTAVVCHNMMSHENRGKQNFMPENVRHKFINFKNQNNILKDIIFNKFYLKH